MQLDKYGGAVIEFHLDGRSGVAPYLQLIHQVR
jgi:GntR family transcriptional regulator